MCVSPDNLRVDMPSAFYFGGDAMAERFSLGQRRC